MKNRKGFTLVELIVTIAIVGIVSVIGVMSYGTISNTVKDQEYKNLKKKIEVAGFKRNVWY